MPYWFEPFFINPTHLHIHQANHMVYLDINMGRVIIFLDRIFGTYPDELASEPVVFGLTKTPEHLHHPVGFIFHE